MIAPGRIAMVKCITYIMLSSYAHAYVKYRGTNQKHLRIIIDVKKRIHITYYFVRVIFGEGCITYMRSRL